MTRPPDKSTTEEVSSVREDEVLRRMLNTPPKLHKDKPQARKPMKLSPE